MPRFLIICIFSLFLFCCKKENKNQTISNIKLSIISGDNQAAETGNPLKDSIAVKVTQNGNPVNNFTLLFTGSGCNSDLTAQIKTNANGIAKYLWRMSADEGGQILNIVAVSNNVRIDSVKATARAFIQSAGYPQISACQPYNMVPQALCQVASGRIFACFNGKTSLRYSDDDGVSWHPVRVLEIITLLQEL